MNDQHPEAAPLEERLVPTRTEGYIHGTRHGNGNDESEGLQALTMWGALAWHDLWGFTQWIQGYEGAWGPSIAMMERLGPWMDNMLQSAYEQGRSDVAGELSWKMMDIQRESPMPDPMLDRGRDGRKDKAP